MTNFPQSVFPTAPTISTLSLESIGMEFIISQGGGPGSTGAWPTANKAIYLPFSLKYPTLIKLMFSVNGSSAANTRDLGIYSEDGTRIVSIGSTAGSGTNNIQTYDITDTLIGPGRFYMAIASSNVTSQFFRAAGSSLPRLQALGIYEQTTAFPLPATATFASLSSLYIPLIGLSTTTLL